MGYAAEEGEEAMLTGRIIDKQESHSDFGGTVGHCPDCGESLRPLRACPECSDPAVIAARKRLEAE